MFTQNWVRINHYPNDYLNLVHNYYAKHSCKSFPCTYYRLDVENSICDKDILNGGSYEDTGILSGLKWQKILLLPVYQIEQITSDFASDEQGVTQPNQISSFSFPSSYGFYPTSWDFVNFQAITLNKNEEEEVAPPLYRVNNFNKATNTAFTFYKLNIKIYHTSKIELENQVSDTYAFFDYEKRLYAIDEETKLYNILEKNSKLRLNDFFKSNLGFYFGA